MKFVPNGVSQKLATATTQLRQQAPHLTFGAGAIGVLGATVLACKATLKLSAIVDDHDYAIWDIHQHDHETAKKADTAYVYMRTATKVAKVYAPSAILMASSLGLMTHSHITMSKRNKALTLAYAGLYKAFDEYRDRVREVIGEDQERDLYLGVQENAEEDDENGEKINVKMVDKTKLGEYARLFDEYNSNWQKSPSHNKLFITCQQNYLNDLLTARGHVFLNEVYDQLGMDRSEAGAIVGWLKSDDPEHKGANYIDFGMLDARNTDFVDGIERSILLDFNVDGVIYDKIG